MSEIADDNLPQSMMDKIEQSLRRTGRFRFCWLALRTGASGHGDWLPGHYCDPQATLDSLNKENAGILKHWLEWEEKPNVHAKADK